MVEEMHDTKDLVTATAGPEVGGKASMMIEEEMAGDDNFCLAAEDDGEKE